MPKDKRGRSASFDGYGRSPLSYSSSCSCQSSAKFTSETEENLKEWEDARCPVCMEHPHNAILLICSSHEKGCRPYMCDTSSRHSNCFDQFCKSFVGASGSATSPEDLLQEEAQLVTTNLLPAAAAAATSEATVTDLPVERTEEESSTPSIVALENPVLSKLACPLCRGKIKDHVVVERARRIMNAKPRSCSSETCDFTGVYKDLRKHARLEHPTVRPSEADPERQRNWRRLERQRDVGDLLSTLQSSFGEERADDDSSLRIDDGSWMTVYFFVRVFQPGSSWSGTSRTRAQSSTRRRSRRHWGESYDGETGSTRDEDRDESSSDSGSFIWRRRVRRRTTPDEQPEL